MALGYEHQKCDREEDKLFFNFLQDSVEQFELEEQFGASLPHRVLLERNNPLDMRQTDFVSSHGMSKFAFRKLLELTTNQLDSMDVGNPRHLPPALKLSALLRFLRSNTFYRCIGSNKDIQMCKATVAKAVHKGARIFATLQAEHVQFPDVDEAQEIALELSAAGFPPVLCGLIDGTHIEVQRPNTKDPSPEKFFNRKGFYSLNVMCVVDHRGKFRYFSTSHAGSAHDSRYKSSKTFLRSFYYLHAPNRIFEESYLRANLGEKFNPRRPFALMGDEGYSCSDILLPPVRKQQLDAAREDMKDKMRAYNKVHKRTRLPVEHALGVLKKRFPALLYSLRCGSLDNVQAIIASAIVIHNILIDLKEPLPNMDKDTADPEFQEKLRRSDMGEECPSSQDKFRFRNHIINKFF